MCFRLFDQIRSGAAGFLGFAIALFGSAFDFSARVPASSCSASPRARVPAHRCALVSRTQSRRNPGSAIAACSVLITSSRSADDGFFASAAANAVRAIVASSFCGFS
ncbi:hypothetical protein MGAST_16700 [Mycobacterium gastri 'Wayne']|uniref:Uncharacterized protein n=1 Tax=Mycobacterium gastri TaxID=1777 RepID=A0A1X1V1M4_MYCGS|nr:hypothetical protein MGAST_16700 [Mycobacterium gastri 'Wayne']ORV62970.1 hypothetical protein AWC07_16625 [Mycobacterium gastri]